jgi:DNA topoisomerase-2
METQQVTAIPVRPIEDFFDNEYLGYSRHVVENRAIPSVIDGFKPSQRKIAFVANRVFKTGGEKPLKVFQLAGRIASEAFYHHGGGSLEAAITTMTQEFKNSMPIFQGIGQFGSLRSPEAGAARYIGVKFNDNFRLLYKDFDLVDPQHEEGEEIEPKFFLPIIPTVLLNGGSGIAVGFATNILNRHPLDLIDACMDALDGKKIRDLRPWIKGFHGTFERSPDSPRSWSIRGSYTVKNTSTVEVTEIPPSFTYEKYESYLDGLVEKGVLSSYDDHSSDRVHYVLKFPRTNLAELQKKNKLDDILKMREGEGENLTTLDENGKLKVFERAEEIVDYFVGFRLGYYGKRKARLLADLTRQIDLLDAKSRFIDAVIKGRIVVANEKKPDIIKAIEKESIPKQDESYDFLLGMPIWSLTYEKYVELQKKLDETTKERDRVTKTSPEDFYRQDLKDLRKQVQKVYGT